MKPFRRRTSPLFVQRGHSQSTVNARTSSVLFLSIAMVLTGILLYLWPQMRLVHLGYRQGTLQSQRFQMLQEQQKLQVELATLRRMSRIEDIATRRLGMRPPRTSQIIYVRAEEQSLASRRP